MHDTWQIYSAADTVLATVKKSSLVQFKTAMDVFLGSSSSSKNPDYVMQGDFLDRNLTIFQGAQQAALVCSLSILPKNQTILPLAVPTRKQILYVCVPLSLSPMKSKQSLSCYFSVFAHIFFSTFLLVKLTFFCSTFLLFKLHTFTLDFFSFLF
jgi:hypothetical protein